MSRHSHVTPETERRIVELHARGWSYSHIAKRLGVGYYAVRRRIDPSFSLASYRNYMVFRSHARVSRREFRGRAEPPKLEWRSQQAQLMGEPAIGRSALDVRPASGPRSSRFELDPAEEYIDSFFHMREDADT
jgi:hypothetical protein